MFRRRFAAISFLYLCTSAWLFAQESTARSSLAQAFDDYSSGPTIDSVAKSSQYAMSEALDPRLIPALPSSGNSALRDHAHYIVEGTLCSSPLPERNSFYPTPYLINQASISDAAIIGVIDAALPSQPTAANAFLYTPFRVYIQEVLFDKGKRLTQGKDITVVRPGVQIALGGVTVIAADAGFAWQRSGEEYIFFLHKVSGAGEYRIYAGGTFRMSTNATVTSDQLSSEPPNISSLGYQSDFLTEIADAYKVSREAR
jgi:hypothetical protein